MTGNTAIELQLHLRDLHVERALADDAEYIADLDDEIATARHAYVRAAVTEITVLRAELSGRQRG